MSKSEVRLILKKTNTDSNGCKIRDDHRTLVIDNPKLESLLISGSIYEDGYEVVGAEVIDQEGAHKRADEQHLKNF